MPGSASPPITPILLRHSESPASATSGLMHRSKIHAYSITSSARSRIDGGGMKMSSTAAVLRFKHKFKSGRRFDWQLGRTRPQQDFGGHDTLLSNEGEEIWSIGHQPTVTREAGE